MTSSRNRSFSILGQANALPSGTRGGSRMRESRSYGSVRGARDETRVPTATATARVHHASQRRRCMAPSRRGRSRATACGASACSCRPTKTIDHPGRSHRNHRCDRSFEHNYRVTQSPNGRRGVPAHGDYRPLNERPRDPNAWQKKLAIAASFYFREFELSELNRPLMIRVSLPLSLSVTVQRSCARSRRACNGRA